MAQRYARVGVSDIAFLFRISPDAARALLAEVQAGDSFTRTVGTDRVTISAATDSAPVVLTMVDTTDGFTTSSDRHIRTV